MATLTMALAKRATPVTNVTQVRSFVTMKSPELVEFCRSKWQSAINLHVASQRRLADLLPALCELECRYKRPGARTDLRDLPPTFYGVLESIGINTGSFRVTRQRAAAKQIEAIATDPAEAAAKKAAAKKKASVSRHKQVDNRIESESAAMMLAKAGIRLAKALTNQILPEKLRLEQAVMLAEELLEAAADGRLDTSAPLTIKPSKPLLISLPKCHQKVIAEQAEPEPDDDKKREAAKSFNNATVREIDYATAKPIIEKFEWLRNTGSSRHYFALYFGEYIGAIDCFGATSANRLGESAVGKDNADRVCTLTRGCTLPWAPTNSASYLISRACDLMTKKGKNVFVAYATEEAGELGCCYIGTNWKYAGKTSTPTMYRAPDGTLADSRMVSALCRDRRGHQDGEPMKYHLSRAEMKATLEEMGYKAERGAAKHRYVYIAGSQTIKRRLWKALRLRWPLLPHPKRAMEQEESPEAMGARLSRSMRGERRTAITRGGPALAKKLMVNWQQPRFN